MLKKIQEAPESVEFKEVIDFIDSNYSFSPQEFKNGEVHNQANTNNGSLKVLSFAILNDLTENQTLNCFGDYYRKDVLGNLNGNDHQNIRNFIKSGFNGLSLSKDQNGLKHMS